MAAIPFPAEYLRYPSTEAAATSYDRRRHLRFPFASKLHYSLKSGDAGEGVLTNISSRGVLFSCGTQLPVGRLIQIFLPWPTLLNGSCPLQLRIQGCVIRSERWGTAATIRRYDFHTASRKPLESVKASGGWPPLIRRAR
ncbi:MAG: PilZ domain-containing protein [Acidobacteriia bacterium]|nr:PilZ domain-containing protein [Terriglobia bacterium]